MTITTEPNADIAIEIFQLQRVESYMKKNGAKTDQLPEGFTRRLNNLICDLNKQLTESYFNKMTGPTTLEVNMTQGMINNAYLMPKRKLDIE